MTVEEVSPPPTSDDEVSHQRNREKKLHLLAKARDAKKNKRSGDMVHRDYYSYTKLYLLCTQQRIISRGESSRTSPPSISRGENNISMRCSPSLFSSECGSSSILAYNSMFTYDSDETQMASD